MNLGTVSCLMPVFWIGARYGLGFLSYISGSKHLLTVAALIGGAFLLGGVALGIAGCFRKGWQVGLPVIGILFNMGFGIYLLARGQL